MNAHTQTALADQRLHAQDETLAALELAQGQVQLIHDLVLGCETSHIELRSSAILHTMIAIDRHLAAAKAIYAQAFQVNV